MLFRSLTKKLSRVTLGMMSGTSADGIDIAACDVNTSERTLRNLASATIDYPDALRNEILTLSMAASVELRELMLLSLKLGHFYADSVIEFIESNGLTKEKIDLIGSHGQTVAHLSEVQEVGGTQSYATLQLGDADVIAKRTGLLTVSDFRSGDIAVAGAGAPLTPIYHALRFSELGHCRAVVNIGGIANATLLQKDGSVQGSDCGPGNCLLDHLIRTQTGKPFDRDGQTAAQGTPSPELVDQLLHLSLFTRPIPRSYDRGEIIALLSDPAVEQQLRDLSLEDAMATLSLLTATTIRNTITALAGTEWPDSILLCGGGALNKHLGETLAELVKPVSVVSTARFGSDPQFVEAEAFAYLANLALDSEPGNLTAVTGAARPAVLGKISQP